MAAVAAEYEGRVEFVGVAGGGSSIGNMANFIEDVGVGGFPHFADVNGDVWVSFGVTYQPAFAFIDDSGEIEAFISSFSQDELRAAADALLAG
ncbi:MAG: TlpA disulfide reductase family protein [Actinomycetota bacterium]